MQIASNFITNIGYPFIKDIAHQGNNASNSSSKFASNSSTKFASKIEFLILNLPLH